MTKKTAFLNITFFVIALIFSANTLLAQRQQMIGTIQADYLNDILLKKQSIPLMVSVSGDKDSKKFSTHIQAGLNTFLTGSCTLSNSQLEKVIKALKKALDWTQTAKKEEIATTKDLYSSWGLKIQFMSHKNGENPLIIMGLFEHTEKRESIIVTLSSEKIQELIALLEKAPQAFNDYKNNEKKADLLR